MKINGLSLLFKFKLAFLQNGKFLARWHMTVSSLSEG